MGAQVPSPVLHGQATLEPAAVGKRHASVLLQAPPPEHNGNSGPAAGAASPGAREAGGALAAERRELAGAGSWEGAGGGGGGGGGAGGGTARQSTGQEDRAAGARHSAMSSPRGSPVSGAACRFSSFPPSGSEGSVPSHGFDRRSGGDGTEGEGVPIKLYLLDKIYRFRASGLREVEQHVQHKLSQGGAPERPAFDLTYRDPQGDTITLGGDDDMLEAAHLMCVDGHGRFDGKTALKLSVEMAVETSQPPSSPLPRGKQSPSAF